MTITVLIRTTPTKSVTQIIIIIKMPIQKYQNPKPHNKFDCVQSDFIAQSLANVPSEFVPFVESRFNYTLKKKGLTSANLQMIDVAESFKESDIDLALSDDDICKLADEYSKKCSLVICDTGVENGKSWAVENGAKLPDSDDLTVKSLIARLSDCYWWRRQLRVKHGRAVEGQAVSLRMVHGKGQIYASNASVKRRTSQRSRNLNMLESVIAVNELGQEYTLAKLAELSTSNPEIRRGELMTRIAGFELYAKHKGHVAEFWTITCPSKMHSMKYSSDRKKVFQNINYDGTTPRKAQAYLSKVWSRIRAYYHRHNIGIYGFRVAEPQHDGTPHWHLLIFIDPSQVEHAREVAERYSLQMDGEEAGAKEYRFKPITIDPARGSAAGYIAKYIAKNIDGYGIDRVDADLTGKRDPMECARRVDTWASTWGIRQFQQIGGHPVSVWRELRRLTEEDTKGTVYDKHRVAADCGNWCEYLEQMDKKPLELLKEFNDKEGRYCEPLGWQIIGLDTEYGIFNFISRKHEWSIKNDDTAINKRVGESEEVSGGRLSGSDGIRRLCVAGNRGGKFRGRGRSDRAGLLKSNALALPWSSVNNCTRAENFTAHVRRFYLYKYWFDYYRSIEKWKLLEKNKKLLMTRSCN